MKQNKTKKAEWIKDKGLIKICGPAKAALARNYLEIYWPYAGGLSAVNAIGTQLRDPINSGLTRWRMAVS